jgi:hypothetical protein
MGNYFQNYYQSKKAGLSQGTALGAMAKDAVHRPTDKQIQLHRDLVAFFKERGIPVGAFEKARNKADYSSKISGMITILKKHGLEAEFFGRRKK